MTEPTTLVPDFSTTQLSFAGSGMTHVGRVREVNEDSILTDPTGIFWAIADGMGGHGHGDMASEIVIDHLSQMPDEGDSKALIDALLSAANEEILSRAAQIGASQIGSTVVVLKLDANVGHLAWVGDCRSYLCRAGSIRQLTRDHTVVEELVRDGILAPENVKNHVNSNVVTRAVGAESALQVDHVEIPLAQSDRLILCSDGLNACVDDPTIRDLVLNSTDPDAACRYLVAEALEKGAPDNISVTVIFVEGN